MPWKSWHARPYRFCCAIAGLRTTHASNYYSNCIWCMFLIIAFFRWILAATIFMLDRSTVSVCALMHNDNLQEPLLFFYKEWKGECCYQMFKGLVVSCAKLEHLRIPVLMSVMCDFNWVHASVREFPIVFNHVSYWRYKHRNFCPASTWISPFLIPFWRPH